MTKRRKASDPPAKGGRTTTFTQAMADRICIQLAEGTSLRTICLSADMPNRSTVFEWLIKNPAFADQYTRARELQADSLFDDIPDIADNPMIGEKRKVNADGTVEITTGDMIEHRRLQIESRKWVAGKLRPKKYGDKLDVDLNHSGKIAVTITPADEGTM